MEIDSGSDDAGGLGDVGGDSEGGINIGDINLGGDGEGGLGVLDILDGADDILDIARLRKGKKGLARQNPLYKKARKAGMPKAPKMRAPGGLGRFGMIKNVMNMGRMALSEGTGPVKGQVNAMVGEAGPEIVTGSPQKLASGGLMSGGTGSSILATGLGAGVGDLMKRVQPFANLMALPFQVVGAHISGALSNLVAAAGPFSGAIAKMFSPLLGGLATIFGLNQGAFAAEINSAAMTEEQGAKQLSKFFANFFKLFGILIGDGGDDEEDDDDSGVAPGAKGLLDFIARYESGGDYNKIFGGKSISGLTDKTIQEVVQIQKAHLAEGFE